MGFGCVLGSFRVFMPCMVQQMLYIGNAWRGKTPRTWHFWNIKIPKPPCISSLKIIGLLHFWKFLGLSEVNYNPQSLWITPYFYRRSLTRVKKWKIAMVLVIGNHGLNLTLKYLSMSSDPGKVKMPWVWTRSQSLSITYNTLFYHVDLLDNRNFDFARVSGFLCYLAVLR